MNMEDLERLTIFRPPAARRGRPLRISTRPKLFHGFLPSFLFLEQLALARDIAAVAFGEHVLAQRLHGGARDDRAADRRLHGDLEHLARDEFVHLVDELAASLVAVSRCTMSDNASPAPR